MKQKITNKKNKGSKKIKPKDELVQLINDLNSAIRNYFNSTKQIILNYKSNHIYISNAIVNIENYLFDFIKTAKDLFSRMVIVRKTSLLEEEKSKTIQGQLYNYCNNNFFYYSNAPTNLNTNSNFFTKINHGRHQKIIYKSPTNKNNNLSNFSNNNIINHNYTMNSQQKYKKDISKIFNSENSASTEISKKLNIPKLKLEQDINKDELIENILNLLKQLNQFRCKIFYETEEAKQYKSIFNSILENLNKLIDILSKERVESNRIKCLTERKQRNSKEGNNILNDNKKYENILKNIENIKKNSYYRLRINKSHNNNIIYSRNPFNQKKYCLSIQDLKSRNGSLNDKTKRARSENSLDKNEKKTIPINKPKVKYIRDILIKEGINEYSEKKKQDIQLIDKDQQTDNIIIEKEIIEEVKIYIESDKKYQTIKLEKEKTIKDLENKIKELNDNLKILNESISKLEIENTTYKNDKDKNIKMFEKLNQENQLLKQYMEKQEKKEKNEIKNLDENLDNKINNNILETNYDMETDLDKMSIKYELLKLEYDKQKMDLEEKEKLLNNYNLYNNLNESKISEEKINQLIKQYENEIEELNQKYTKDILELKINLPNCFSASTHEILIDKKYPKLNLHWYLLTVTSAKKKDYENTFWVSEDEIKSTLKDFKEFKTEEDIEKENINVYITAQQKLIKRIENNEDTISNLKNQIQKLKGEK